MAFWMYLYEFQGKELFRKFGIPVPGGIVIGSPGELDGKDISYPAVVKAQVLTGGRGKAGGIKFAGNAVECKAAAQGLFSAKLKGLNVRYVLVESKLDIARELYVSVSIDRGRKCPLVMASVKGGVDIESINDSELVMHHVDPLIGFSPFITRKLCSVLGLKDAVAQQFSGLLQSLYRLFEEYDAELAEINPLVVTKDGRLVAADAKLIIDQDSMYRHPDVKNTYDDLTPLENEARVAGYSFVELDGEIGVIANGAGLTMATLDSLLLHKLRPRNFLDLGGTDNVDIVRNAFAPVLKAGPKLIFVNIFGGVTKCDTVAEGIVKAKGDFNIGVPLVVRLSGVHEEEGRTILGSAGIQAFSNMTDAVKRVAELYSDVRGGGV